MATIKLITRGNKNPSTLYIRLVNGRNLDISSSINLSVNPEHWDNKKSNYRNINSINDRAKKQAQFEKLKTSILEAYNDDFMQGEVIDKDWLKQTVSSYFNRPKGENNLKIKKHFVYYSDFCRWWLKNKASTWKTSKNKYLSSKVIAQYEAFLNIWRNFEDKNHIKINTIGVLTLDSLVDYMVDRNYSESTIKRQVTRAKFFLNRAKTEGIECDLSYLNPVFVEKNQEDITEPYLNESEINAIYNLDLNHDYELENARDNFIIGLWTGLRISDFNKNLDISNINGDYIRIKTQKTGAWVVIPLHPQVKEVLNKRFGNLPEKTTNKKFNKHIKTICMLAEIDQEIKGGKIIVDKETKVKRKVFGTYKKYQLISSHVARRSFATNLFGYISNKDLMSIAGWSSENMMMHYVKKTKTESADQLKMYWEQKYK